MSWTPEDRLILECCRRSSLRHDKRLDFSDHEPVAWDVFLSKVRKEGVVPLVHKRLSAVVPDNVEIPLQVREELEQGYYATAARNAVQFQELGRILHVLREQKIKVMVLKGAALVENIYGNLGLRAMADIDLLIQKDDLPDFNSIMEQVGYTSPDIKSIDPGKVPENYLTSVVYTSSSPTSPCFHVHWHFVNSTIPNESFIQKINLSHLWQDSQTSLIAGVETLVMSPHHLLIHLAEHSLRVTHSLTKLSLLCDINETVAIHGNKIDWKKFLTECEKSQISEFVYFPLFFAAKLLHAEIPQNVIQQLAPSKPSFSNSIFKKMIEKNCRFPGLSYLLHFSRNRGIMAKIHFVMKTIFPPRQVIAQRLAISPVEIGPIFYLRRFAEVCISAARVLCKLCWAKLRPQSHPIS